MGRRHPGPLFWMVTWRSDIYLCPEAQHSVGTLLNPCPKGFCGISVVFRQWASSLHTWNCTQRNRETRAWLIYHTIFIMRYSPIILLLSVRSAEVLHVFSNYSRWEFFFPSCPSAWRWEGSTCNVRLLGLLWMFSRIKWHHLLKECLLLWKSWNFSIKIHPFFSKHGHPGRHASENPESKTQSMEYVQKPLDRKCCVLSVGLVLPIRKKHRQKCKRDSGALVLGESGRSLPLQYLSHQISSSSIFVSLDDWWHMPEAVVFMYFWTHVLSLCIHMCICIYVF